MKIFRILTSFFSLVSILYNQIEIVECIISGHSVKHGSFGYNVVIKISGSEDLCNGVIIGPQHILSVASCFINQQNMFNDIYYTVIANARNLLDEHSIIVTVDRIYVSKDLDSSTIFGYSSRSIGNLAVLKLTDPLQLGGASLLDKVNLPWNPAVSNYESEVPVVSGFGVTSSKTLPVGLVKNLIELCDTLQAALTNVIPNQLCQAGFSFPLHEKHICAKLQPNSRRHIGTCYGDIGAPLVGKRNLLIGLLSNFRSDCNEKEYPALYTRITPYIEFIHKAVLERPSPSDTRYAAYKNKETVGMRGSGMTLQEYHYHI